MDIMDIMDIRIDKIQFLNIQSLIFTFYYFDIVIIEFKQ